MTKWVRHTRQNIKTWAVSKIWAIIARVTCSCDDYPEQPNKLAAASCVSPSSAGGTKPRGHTEPLKPVMYRRSESCVMIQIFLWYASFLGNIMCMWMLRQQVKGRILIIHSSILANLKYADVICHAKYFSILLFVLVCFPRWYFIALLRTADRNNGDTASPKIPTITYSTFQFAHAFTVGPTHCKNTHIIKTLHKNGSVHCVK